VVGYCRAANLDPMQKPVHIVPMWDAKAGRMRDVIMPGVNLYRIQASRSGAFAGISEPEFGPNIVAELGGVEVNFPEWCRVTVKRQLASGIICDFTAVEYWMENYAIKGGKDRSQAPNAMWMKRPRGQIAKCAAAQALRSAFPEIAAQYTAEEMEGKEMHHDEPDALDQPKNLGLSPARYKIVRKTACEALQLFNEDDEMGAYGVANAIIEEQERLALWSILKPHSALRACLKRLGEEERAREDALKHGIPTEEEAAAHLAAEEVRAGA
jgi:phage recombination protein Bet